MKRITRVLLFALLFGVLMTACGKKQPQYDFSQIVTYPTEAVEETDENESPPALNEEEISPDPDEDETPPDSDKNEALPDTDETSTETITEDGVYDDVDSVASYIHIYGKLPSNYMTKKEAQKLGWEGGTLKDYAPGMCIGGDHYGNYEGLLPDKKGRKYYECDIDTIGRSKRGAKRIIYSNDGLIYYTDDHYASFTLLYGTE